MPFGLGTQTPKVTTGNVRTTFDPFTPSPGATTPGPTPNPFNGLANPLGTIFQDQGGADGVSGTTTQLPVGCAAVYKYVLYKSTANPALLAFPAPVYYTDNTFTIVTGKASEAVGTAASFPAGLMMINSTDLTTITATILNNGGNGSGVWICINGFVKGAAAPAATVAGDMLVGSADFAWARSTAFAAGTIVAARSLTALSGSQSDQQVALPVDV
jgi:hypothetical protein